MQAIRDRYGVPASRGARVKFQGRPMFILSADGHHLWLRDTNAGRRVGPCHPLWEMDYLDGIDHGARYDARVEAFNRALNARSPAPRDSQAQGEDR
jgi:hypothetical protein